MSVLGYFNAFVLNELSSSVEWKTTFTLDVY